MANLYAGQTLVDIGKNLPGMIKTNRDSEEEKRLNEIRKKILQEQLLSSELERTLKGREEARSTSGRESIAKTIELMYKPQQEPVLPEVKPEYDFGINTKPQRSTPSVGNIPALQEQFGTAPDFSVPKFGEGVDTQQTRSGVTEPVPYRAPLGAKEALIQSGAAGYMDLPEVSGFAKQFDPYSLNQAAGGGATGARFRAATEEDRIAARATVDALVKNGEIAPEVEQAYRAMAERDPIRLNDLITNKNRTVEEGLRQYEQTNPLAAERAAGTTAASTEAGEKKKREIQADNPILSDAQSGSLSDAYNAIDYLNLLKRKVTSGDVGYFDIDKRTGQFVNPEAADAFMQMVEIVGRKRSGAAISESEWGNFGKQILNKNNLLTEEGRKTAINSIERYLDKFYGAGVTTTGNDDWYSNYQKRLKEARRKGEATRGDNEDTGSTFTDEKRRRLEELRAKKAAGTLGR